MLEAESARVWILPPGADGPARVRVEFDLGPRQEPVVVELAVQPAYNLVSGLTHALSWLDGGR